MVFTKFVEVGRVCVINYGKDVDKLCVIINVVDVNRVLVDGPHSLTGVSRHVINIKRITLTNLKVDIGIHATVKSIKKAFEKDDILNKFKEEPEGKRISKQQRNSAMNDFDRFKLKYALKKKGEAVKKKLAELRK